MKPVLLRALLCAPLLWPVLAPAHAQSAAADATISAAHTDAILLMLSRIKGEAILADTLRQQAGKDPALRELAEYLIKTTPPQEMHKVIAPAIATRIGREDAQRIGNAISTPAAFKASPLARLLAEAKQAALPDIQVDAASWSERRLKSMLDLALATAVRQLDANARAAGEGKPRLVLPEKTGYAPVDRFVALLVVMPFRRMSAFWTLSRLADEPEEHGMFKARNLVSKERIDAGRKWMARFELAMQPYLRAQRADLDLSIAAFAKINMPGNYPIINSLRDELAQRTSAINAFEKEQRVVVSMREMFDFAEAHLGQTRAVGDELVFNERADQRTYDAMRKTGGGEWNTLSTTIQ